MRLGYRQATRLALLLIGAQLLAAGNAGAALVLPNGTGQYQVRVTSMLERQWQRVVRQQYDYSCGSAAVATLLTYHYGIPRNEAQVFEAMFAVGNQPQIREHGFSMLDMKRYLDGVGLNADGFRMSLDKLAAIGVPGIALVNTGGYQHFVVIKGLRDGTVLVGDPAGGTIPVDRSRFEQMWNGIVLAARGRIEVARNHFNHEGDWAVRPEAPIATVRGPRPSLPVQGLHLPGLREFGR